jgi:hypothetical protein
VDPLASKYASLSPYNYAFNNPVSLNDPTGADPYIDALSYGIMISNGGSMGRVQQMADRRVLDPGFGVYNGAYSTWRGPVYNDETKSHHLVQFHGGKTGYFVNQNYWDGNDLVVMPWQWKEVPTNEYYSFKNQVNGYGRGQSEGSRYVNEPFIAGFIIPDNEFGYDEWNLAREVIGGGMVASGQPWIPKRFVTKATSTSKSASRGTSVASKNLSKVFPQQMPVRVMGTRVVGRALGRMVPYVGWALLTWDALDLGVKSGDSFINDNPQEFWRKARENVTTIGMYNEW